MNEEGTILGGLFFTIGFLVFIAGIVGVITGKLPKIAGRRIPAILLLAGVVLIVLAGLTVSSPTTSQTPSQASQVDAQATEALKKYLDEHFGDMNWYNAITEIEVRATFDGQRYAIVRTNLPGTKEAQPQYSSIFTAVSNSPLSLTWTDILGQNGDYLVKHDELIRFAE